MNSLIRIAAPLLLSTLLAPVAEGATLSVNVIDDETGAPVVGAEVFAGTDGRGAVALTDATGFATIEVEGSGPFTVTAASLESLQLFGRRLYTTNATTVQGVTGTDVEIEIGFNQVLDTLDQPSGFVSNTQYDGTITGLDVTLDSAWIVRSPTSTTGAALNGVNTAGYSLVSEPGAAPFLYSAQVPITTEGSFDGESLPLTYDIIFDAPNNSTLSVGKHFTGSQSASFTGIVTSDVTGITPSTCSNYDVLFPEGYGSLSYEISCQDTDTPAFSWATPDLNDLPAGTTFAVTGNVAYGTGAQWSVKSGFDGSAEAVIDFKPLPNPTGYEPLYLADLPGATFNITDAPGLDKEIIIFSESHAGPGGFLLSVTTWTNINYAPSQALTFPKVPRASSNLPALGARLPVVNSQTALAITTYEEDLWNFDISFNYLETFAPAPEPTPTPAPREQADAPKVQTLAIPGLEGRGEALMLDAINR